MKYPIGIFDSGVGGLSVLKEVVELLPNESLIYLADSFNCPYGNKTEKEIIDLSVKNVEFLLSHNCKLIIIACNTATAAAIKTLRNRYKVPFVGMEPAVKPASLISKTKNVGILATAGTFNGGHFNQTSKKFANHVTLHLQIGNGLVEFIENGDLQNMELEILLKKYLNPMIENNVDQIVLGCSHYPFLIKLMKSILGDKINIIDPAPSVAKRVKFLLNELDLFSTDTSNRSLKFYTTGNSKIMEAFLLRVLKIKSEVYKMP